MGFLPKSEDVPGTCDQPPAHRPTNSLLAGRRSQNLLQFPRSSFPQKAFPRVLLPMHWWEGWWGLPQSSPLAFSRRTDGVMLHCQRFPPCTCSTSKTKGERAPQHHAAQQLVMGKPQHFVIVSARSLRFWRYNTAQRSTAQHSRKQQSTAPQPRPKLSFETLTIAMLESNHHSNKQTTTDASFSFWIFMTQRKPSSNMASLATVYEHANEVWNKSKVSTNSNNAGADRQKEASSFPLGESQTRWWELLVAAPYDANPQQLRYNS